MKADGCCTMAQGMLMYVVPSGQLPATPAYAPATGPDLVVASAVASTPRSPIFDNVTDINNIGYKVLHIDRCALST